MDGWVRMDGWMGRKRKGREAGRSEREKTRERASAYHGGDQDAKVNTDAFLGLAGYYCIVLLLSSC